MFLSMEKVEEANKAAIESSNRVLSLLSLPKDQLQYSNLMMKTSEAVFKFKKVVSSQQWFESFKGKKIQDV